MSDTLTTLTLAHVVISVLGIVAGLVVAGALVAGVLLKRWTGLFLTTTLVTSASGFAFPFTRLLPSHVVGVISIVVLAVGLLALYGKQLAGRWRTWFVVTAVAALYLNVFVLMVQLFVKTPALARLAPTQSEPPFAVSQAIVLVIFVWLGWAAVRGFQSGSRRFPAG